MKAPLLSLALLLGFAAPAAANVTLELVQPVFEIGLPGQMIVSGTPGDIPFLLHSPDPGPVALPYVGLVDVGPTNLKIVLLPTIPASGSQLVTCQFACSAALASARVYAQIVAITPAPFAFCKSDQKVVEFSDGDCSLICSGGVQQLGLQTEICNLPTTQGNVLVEVRDGIQVIDLALFTNIDLLSPPALPLTIGGVTLQVVDYDPVGNCVTIRFCVDSNGFGASQLPPTTTIMTDWINCDVESPIPTDCTFPIAVGDTFGAYVVTKLIDLF